MNEEMVRIHLSDSLQLHTSFSLRSFFGALWEWSLSGPVLSPSVIIRVDSHIFRNYLGWKSSSSIHNKAHECMLSHFSCVWLCATIWTVACQPPLSKGLFRKEYWSGLPCPPPGDLPDPGIEPWSLLQAYSLPYELQGGPSMQHTAVLYSGTQWTGRCPRALGRVLYFTKFIQKHLHWHTQKQCLLWAPRGHSTWHIK